MHSQYKEAASATLTEADPLLSGTDKISIVIARTIEECLTYRRLLQVIHDYLGHIRTAGGNPDERVRRRTIRMKHLLAGLLIEGQRSGEFGRFSVKAASELLYSLIESGIFRITVLGREDAGSLVASARLVAESLRSQAAVQDSAAQDRS